MPDIQLIQYHKPGTATIRKPESILGANHFVTLWGTLARLAETEEMEEGAVYEFMHGKELRAATFIKGYAYLCTMGVKGYVEVLDD